MVWLLLLNVVEPEAELGGNRAEAGPGGSSFVDAGVWFVDRLVRGTLGLNAPALPGWRRPGA
jgi:hypothetical protein